MKHKIPKDISYKIVNRKQKYEDNPNKYTWEDIEFAFEQGYIYRVERRKRK